MVLSLTFFSRISPIILSESNLFPLPCLIAWLVSELRPKEYAVILSS